ncbi:ATP-grasp domain-containing protein [Lentzea sp. E54]|uniref:ATP-grasp domain-containing protein n=1 Tax=Lentzea xerophila TaxID=3435883 RepID=UPI003DA4B1C4
MSGRSIVVVDPFAAGKGIAPAFAARGVEAIAVLTSPIPPPSRLARVWNPDDYHEMHTLGDLDELAAKLAVRDPIAVVAGSATGVEAAETLSELVVPGRSNALTLSSARRDRWQRDVALRIAEVPHLRQTSSESPDEVAAWLRREGLESSPIVLRPQDSRDTDDVFVAMPGEDWRTSFNRILVVNRTTFRNDKVLVRELAAGTEYEVDTYSVDGEHGLAAVWRCARTGRGDGLGIVRSNTLVSPSEPVVDVLFDHVRQVLDATGVRNGPAHAEVMITAAGPRLVEIGARLAGAEQQELTLLGTGENQITRMVRQHADGSKAVGRYVRHQHVKSVYLASPAAGELGNSVRLDELAALLPSYHSGTLPYREGSIVPRTDDLRTSLGSVVLATTDVGQLDRDEALIREIETGLIVV